MANHTQTGSISFEATNAVHLSAEGQYESLSGDLRDNYYTKSEFTVAPDKILSTVKEHAEQSARPNLSPYFSHPLTDIYSNDTNPDGYWTENRTDFWTNLTDGWGHVERVNSSSSTAWCNFYVFTVPNGLKPDTKYTFLVEWRNAVISGTGPQIAPTTVIASTPDCFVGAVYSSRITNGSDGSEALVVTTVTDLSQAVMFSRGYISMPAGTSMSMDVRISFYEGEYSGPYKPYVDQSLITRVSTAETAIEQNAEAITLRATKTEAQQMAQPNLSPYFSAAKADVYNATTNPNGYWSRIATNSQFTTYTMEEMHNGSGGWAHFAGNATSNSPFVRFEPVLTALKPSTTYTFLVEWDGTFSNSGNVNLQLFSGKGQSDAVDPFATAKGVLLKGAGAATSPQYVTVSTRADMSEATVLGRSYLQVYGTGAFDCYVRISLYEGEYEGPYKPYSGTQLYASQAQLKVANDEIDLRVEKSGVIAAINASTEAEGGSAVKISADKVAINGTAVFSAIEDQLNAAYDTKGAAATVQGNLDNLAIGGTNLLRSSGVWEQGTWRPSTGEHLTSTTRLRSSKDGWYVPVEPNAMYVIGRHAVDSSVDYYVVLYAYDSSGAFVLTDSVTEWITSFPYTYVPATATRLEVGIRRSDNAAISVSEAAAARLKLERGNKATDWSPAPEDQSAYVDSSIDGIQVGGRNLLRRTATPFSYAINTTNYGTHHLYSTGSTDTAYDGPTLEELGFGVGDEVTFTFDWKTSQNGSAAIRYGSFRVEYYGVTSSGTNGYITAMAGGVVTMSESNASGRFSRTATLTAATIKTQRMVLRIDNSALVFTVSNAKLEKGNKATDWTPAPEDVTSRTQRIYYRTSSSTAPTSQYMPTAWVTETGDKWAANSTTVANWTAKATKLTNGTTKYPYLFTCEQRQMGDGTLAYTTVLLDETTTVIDGGTIITNSIDANKLTVYDATIGKIKADAIDVSAIKIGDLDGASTVVSNAANGKSAYDRHTAYRGTCSTAAGTAAKVVACTGFALATGATVEVYCSTANTANVPTLNVNSTGNKPIWINGAVASASNPCKWLAGDTVTFTYDGTRFRASLPVEGYVTEGTGGGLMVHRKSDATTGVQITDDVDIVRDGVSVALFGTDENNQPISRVGLANAGHTEQKSGSFDIYVKDETTQDILKAVSIHSRTSSGTLNTLEFYAEQNNSIAIDAEDFPDDDVMGPQLYIDTYSATPNRITGVAIQASAMTAGSEYKSARIYVNVQQDGTRDITFSADTIWFSNDNVIQGDAIASLPASKLTGTIADSNLPTKGSAGTAGTSSATSGATLAVPYVTTDAYGRVTAKGTHTHTIGSLAASAVTTGEFDAARIPNLDASKINAGTFDAARIPSLNASKINAGTFNAARIPNLNASKINAGTLNSARLPTVPVNKGGTGQTGVTTVTDVASFIAAASGVTVSSVRVTVWGKLVHAYVTAKPDAAKTSAWVVGTVVDAYRPNAIVTGKPYYTGVDSARIQTNGQMQITACGAVEVGVSFTYLLA